VLKGRITLPEARKTHKFIAEKLWNRVKFYSNSMQKMPFIRMIAVCNNLAYDNANEKSDIDLFIVVKDGIFYKPGKSLYVPTVPVKDDQSGE